MTPFTESLHDSVAAIGEEALIARIRTWLGDVAPSSPAGPGDDCAVITPRPGARLLVTADPVVLRQHFDDSTPPAAVARKLLRRNLSDIAAMGGTPRFAVVTWTIPRRTRLGWLASFHRALGRDALRHGVTINGGDISSSSADLSASLTLIGEAPRRTLLRSGARVGDKIYVTGELGGSILGKHLRFEPRLAEGRWLATQAGVRSMIDVSDGIAKELRLITPKGARPSIEASRLPVSQAARKLAETSGRSSIEHALTDGEDFELLFAVSPGSAKRIEAGWSRRFRTRLTQVGRFVRKGAKTPGAIGLDRLDGFAHFSSTRGP